MVLMVSSIRSLLMRAVAVSTVLAGIYMPPTSIGSSRRISASLPSLTVTVRRMQARMLFRADTPVLSDTVWNPRLCGRLYRSMNSASDIGCASIDTTCSATCVTGLTVLPSVSVTGTDFAPPPSCGR